MRPARAAGGLSPEQLYVGPAHGDGLGRRGGSAEVEGHGVLDGGLVELGAVDPQVLAVVVDALAVEEVAQDTHHLVGALVAPVVVQVVSVGPLFGRVTTGDDVEPEPPSGEPPEGVGLLGQQGRAGETGAEGDQEPDAVGVLGEGRGEDPRIYTSEPHGGQQRVESSLFGGASHLGQVADVRGTAGGGAGPPLHGRDSAGIAAVTARGEEPVEEERVLGHEGSSWGWTAAGDARRSCGCAGVRAPDRAGGAPEARTGVSPEARTGDATASGGRCQGRRGVTSATARTAGAGRTEHGRDAREIHVTPRHESCGHAGNPGGAAGSATSAARMPDGGVPGNGRWPGRPRDGPGRGALSPRRRVHGRSGGRRR